MWCCAGENDTMDHNDMIIEKESNKKSCVNCGSPSDTTVKGRNVCNGCKSAVYAYIVSDR